MTSFSGIWVPILTPFRINEAGNSEVDVVALQALTRHLVGAGVAGLVACGTTGEAASLSEQEQLAVLGAVLDVADCPVMMGLSSNSIADALGRMQGLKHRSVAGLLVPPPYYVRPSQAGIAAYYLALADAATAPLIVYNIPYRTGVAITRDTYRTIAAHPRIVATKDCGGDSALTMRLIEDGQLQVLAGEDQQLLGSLALGASGGILAAAHIRPDLFVRIARLMQQGDLETARTVFYRLLPMIRLLFSEPNPGPLKAAFSMMGMMQDEVRAPMQPASAELRVQLAEELQRLECV